jgi:hypothetical protein
MKERQRTRTVKRSVAVTELGGSSQRMRDRPRALARPGDRLAWITDEDEVARRAYEDWGFRGLKASARPKDCTSRHYLRRIER